MKTKLPFTSIMDYEREINVLKKQREKANKQKQAEITTRLSVLEKSKEQYQYDIKYWLILL